MDQGEINYPLQEQKQITIITLLRTKKQEMQILE